MFNFFLRRYSRNFSAVFLGTSIFDVRPGKIKWTDLVSHMFEIHHPYLSKVLPGKSRTFQRPFFLEIYSLLPEIVHLISKARKGRYI